ncbi:MAG: flippase [Armatimonadota bacterium]
MSTSKRFAKNSLALTIASLSITFLGAIYRIFIAKYLGDVEFGKYSFITTYVSYFSALSLFGLRYVITREVARSPEKCPSILRESIKIRGLTTSLAFGSAYVILLFLGKGTDVQVGVFIYGLSLFAVAAMDIVEGLIVAREASFYITISALVSNALKIFIGITALALGYGLMAILVIYLAISILNTSLSWWFCHIVFSDVRSTKSRPDPHLRQFLIHESIPFLFLALLSRVYYKNDIILLSIFKTDRIVGWYSAAYLPVDALLVVASSISLAAYPLMSKLFGEDSNNLKNFSNSLSKYLLMLFIPVAITLTAVGPQLMRLIFGKSYATAMPVLQLLGWMPVAEVVTCGMGNVLSATYNQQITARVTVLNAAINLGICLLLIPKYSYWGGAIGTVVSAYITLAIVTWVVNRHILKVDWLSNIVKPLVCALFALAALLLAANSIGPWLSWLIGLATFAIATLVTGTFRRYDRDLILSIFRKSRTSE